MGGETPEARYARLADAFRGRADAPGSTLLATNRGFGSDALKRGGKIFAMLVRGQLVVKLPRARVDALVSAGAGAPFHASQGRRMKEWVVVESESFETWLAVAEEALAFATPR